MDNPGLSHVQTSPILPNAACLQNAAGISENSARMKSTSKLKQFNEFIKCNQIYSLLVPRLLLAGGRAASVGGYGPPSHPPLQPPPPPWRGMALAGDGRHHSSCHRYRAEQAEEIRCSDES